VLRWSVVPPWLFFANIQRRPLTVDSTRRGTTKSAAC
jgi:hypothetical protein